MRTQAQRSPRYSWREVATREINSFTGLPRGEDSWSPHRPSNAAMDEARALLKVIALEGLPAAVVSASPDGVISLEWRKPDRQVAFYCFDDGRVEAFALLPGRAPIEAQIQHQLGQANELLEAFLR